MEVAPTGQSRKRSVRSCRLQRVSAGAARILLPFILHRQEKAVTVAAKSGVPSG